jgi:hypothetical protein
MKYVFLCLTLVLGTFGPASADLTLTLELERSSYSVGGPIGCKIVLTNRGTESVTVNDRFLIAHSVSPEQDIKLLLTGPDGYKVPLGVISNAGPLDESDFSSLGKGQSIEKEVDLALYFILPGPGKYSLGASYENFASPAGVESPWQGELVSEGVRFELE